MSLCSEKYLAFLGSGGYPIVIMYYYGNNMLYCSSVLHCSVYVCMCVFVCVFLCCSVKDVIPQFPALSTSSQIPTTFGECVSE